MLWTYETEQKLRRAGHATLLARTPHPTKIELVRVTFVVELRNGDKIELTEEAWK